MGSNCKNIAFPTMFLSRRPSLQRAAVTVASRGPRDLCSKPCANSGGGGGVGEPAAASQDMRRRHPPPSFPLGGSAPGCYCILSFFPGSLILLLSSPSLPDHHISRFSRRRHCRARTTVAGPRPPAAVSVRASSSGSTPLSHVSPALLHAVDDRGRGRRRGSCCLKPGNNRDGRRGVCILGHLCRLAPPPLWPLLHLGTAPLHIQMRCRWGGPRGGDG